MSSVHDIARSGILAYRAALAVTSENLANVHTEGYVRREIVARPSVGGVMTPSGADSPAKSVRVTEVRRAFDGLTADRLRMSDSALGAASVQVSVGNALEDLFLPGVAIGGIAPALENFLDGLNTLASQPADRGLRQVALRQVTGVADAFSQAGEALGLLHRDTLAQAKLSIGAVNAHLSDLAALNHQMLGMGQAMGALNPLHDMRDRLLSDLAHEVSIETQLDGRGRATVWLDGGEFGQGALLLAKDSAARLALDEGPPLGLRYISAPGVAQINGQDSALQLALPQKGALGGQGLALAALQATQTEIDTLARDFAQGINALHRGGIDLNGQVGGDLFVLGAEGGAAGMTMAIGMQGAAGAAALAAAMPGVVAAAAENQGRAQFSARPESLAPTALPDMATLWGGSGSAHAIEALQPGIIGVIGAGSAREVELASLTRQATADFILSDADLALGGQLRLDLGEGSYEFTFPAGRTAADIAAELNAGALLSGDGDRLSALGIQAAGVAGLLSFASGTRGNFTGGALTLATGAVQAPTLTSAKTDASDLRVFTRYGQQVSGAPMEQSAALLLLRPENGFLPDAEYRPAPDMVGGVGYRGMEITQRSNGSDPIDSGLAQLIAKEEGLEEWYFRANPAFDGGGVSSDGLSASAAGLTHEITINGVMLRHQGGSSSEEITAGLMAVADDVGLPAGVTLGLSEGGGLRFEAVAGVALNVDVHITSDLVAEGVHLRNLPPEDLIVMLGTPGDSVAEWGTLRLAGEISPFNSGTQMPTPSGVMLEMLDPEQGEIALYDDQTGDLIATTQLDAMGDAALAGWHVALEGGNAMAGDRFYLTHSGASAQDGRMLSALIAFTEEGGGRASGFARRLAEIMSDVGAGQQANIQKEASLQAGHEALSRKMAEIGAVDLDTEAARLIELQQAYQASAEALSIAGKLFDTIIGVM